ncbi:MAG: hypothetical protein PGN37_19030 [Mycobacterium kyogaense]|uniref:hypothetical protein n=1 Tax=Mycobacterium kyogaense TaxID=2212479 RepID=UPI002FFA6EAA
MRRADRDGAGVESGAASVASDVVFALSGLVSGRVSGFFHDGRFEGFSAGFAEVSAVSAVSGVSVLSALPNRRGFSARSDLGVVRAFGPAALEGFSADDVDDVADDEADDDDAEGEAVSSAHA